MLRIGTSVITAKRARNGAPSRFAAAMVLMFVCVVGPALLVGTAAHAENPDVSMRRGAERTGFTNAEILDGFFKIAFGAELRVTGNADRVRKFDGPVRVFLDNRANVNRRADLAGVIADIRAHVRHLDVAMTDDRKAANIVVTLVRDRGELKRTMRTFYGRARADEIERRLTPQCLSGFSEDPEHRIRRSEVILTAEGGEFGFLNCAYEELLQALGPINDDRSVPWTMFNDEVQMGFFDVYDQYILNILYDPRLRPGMTRQEVAALLPEVLPAVRTWVSAANALPGEEARNDTAEFSALSGRSWPATAGADLN
jgi:Protein of unknown function (DUF2927)